MNLKFNASPVTYVILLLALCNTQLFQVLAQEPNNIPPQWLKPDAACGPRCLSALMQITKKAKSKRGIDYIYKLIGKKPLTPTTLKDLKVAAEKLGFSAIGYKLTFEQLRNFKTYAILPVGRTTGTPTDPFHFILLKEVKGDFATYVNTQNLQLVDISLSDLQKMWNGYVLLLSTNKNLTLFNKHKSKTDSKSQHEQQNFDGINDFKIVDSGSKLEHTFSILNETKKRCNLRILSKSCSCLSPELANSKLEPGEKTSLKLNLSVDKPGWSIATVAIALEPAGIVKRYAVKAYGKDSFNITPPIGYIEVPDKTPVKYPVKITYYTDSNDPITFDHMETDLSGLSTGNVAAREVKSGLPPFLVHVL